MAARAGTVVVLEVAAADALGLVVEDQTVVKDVGWLMVIAGHGHRWRLTLSPDELVGLMVVRWRRRPLRCVGVGVGSTEPGWTAGAGFG